MRMLMLIFKNYVIKTKTYIMLLYSKKLMNKSNCIHRVHSCSPSEQNRRLFNNTRSCDLSEEKFRSTLADLEELNDPTQLVSYTSQVDILICKFCGSAFCLNQFSSAHKNIYLIKSAIKKAPDFLVFFHDF